MQKIMTDNISTTDKDKLTDRFMQPNSAAFQKFNRITTAQNDKKENEIYPRFVFLKFLATARCTHLLLPHSTKLTLRKSKKVQSCKRTVIYD
jgi:hypothetical protein